MNKKGVIDENIKNEIEKTTQEAFNKSTKLQKQNTPQVVQNGKINIANLGSGNINFSGMTLDEITSQLGKLKPMTTDGKSFQIYTLEDDGETNFIFDDDHCIGALYNSDRIKQKFEVQAIQLEECKKRNKLLLQRISDLKDEIQFLRTKI